MATLVHASTDWQVFVNKNGGMCEKFDELHEELFWRARTLKTQIFKKLKGIFCTSRYKNKQRTGYFVF